MNVGQNGVGLAPQVAGGCSRPVRVSGFLNPICIQSGQSAGAR